MEQTEEGKIITASVSYLLVLTLFQDPNDID